MSRPRPRYAWIETQAHPDDSTGTVIADGLPVDHALAQAEAMAGDAARAVGAGERGPYAIHAYLTPWQHRTWWPRSLWEMIRARVTLPGPEHHPRVHDYRTPTGRRLRGRTRPQGRHGAPGS